MKIAKFEAKEKSEARLGVVVQDQLFDLTLSYASYVKSMGSSTPYKEAFSNMPPDLKDVVSKGKQVLESLNALEEFVRSSGTTMSGPNGENLRYNINEVKLLPPLPSLSSKIVCLARNFSDHVKGASGGDLPERPAAFLKLATSVVGPGAPITYPSITKQLDYEVEIAAIIGHKIKDVRKEDALEQIIGYTAFNDISIRDQPDKIDFNCFFFGKNFDTSASMGPWFVTADEIKNPHNLKMTTHVNGETRQNGNSSNMGRKFDEIIEYFTRDNTFYPGDIVTSGTPSGTGIEKKDGSWYLSPGDELELNVESIGTLRNRILEK